ncbi:hypothetical protein [Vagococcus fluvialis]|uniref:hypothetical protein n=1 Tax=Vagococcus fluvialis TaxID=2738 RepID=UPI001D0BAAB9|nr:hypothetical protein [Vagococcus fluvialis]UDM72390.1 hypothetical protein K5L00_06660 [Vagococcus fluvialis]UDM77255.1 hypothetical protein K5K98_02200 [Vagococcus fluvialis]UDM81525.1 hypothetical protein K5K96_09135 [Vagococcus fluvialis]
MDSVYIDNIEVSGEKLEKVTNEVLKIFKDNKVTFLEYELLKELIEKDVKKDATL